VTGLAECNGIGVRAERSGESFKVTLDLSIELPDGFGRGQILLRPGNSTLAIRSVATASAEVETIESGKGSKFFLISPTEDWRGVATVKVETAWFPAIESSEGNKTCCLVLPDFAPSLISVESPLDAAEERKQPSVLLQDELPAELDAGGISDHLEDDGSPSPTLLQSVIFETRLIRNSAEHPSLAVVSPAALDPKRVNGLMTLVDEMLDFLGETLGVQPAVRVCILVAADPFEFSLAPGAMIAVRDDLVGFGPGRRVQGHTLARLLAGIWWGAGCRVLGEDSVALTSAITSMLGLLWLDSTGSRNVVPSLLDRHRVIASDPSKPVKTSSWQASALTLALYESVSHRGVRDALKQLTKACWGEFVTQQTVTDALRAAGAEMPSVFPAP
jgi:hypothetical protein